MSTRGQPNACSSGTTRTPGVVLTPGNRDIITAPAVAARFRELVPMERVAEPEETIPESEEETEISTQIEALMPENEDEL